MTTLLNVHADVQVTVNNHIFRVIGRGSSIVIKFESVGALTNFFLNGGKLFTSGAVADRLAHFLCSTGMTIYLQHRVFPVVGAKASNSVSKAIAWLLKLRFGG